MARPATGQVIERNGKRGRTFALRFRAYGDRQYVTLGLKADGWTRPRAEQELADTLALVRKGIWRPATPEPAPVVHDDPTFLVFASEWLPDTPPELITGTSPSTRTSLANASP